MRAGKEGPSEPAAKQSIIVRLAHPRERGLEEWLYA